MNTPAQNPETQSSDSRDPKGQFTRGNSGGPGNPFGRQVAILRKVLLTCVTEEEMAAIGNKLVDMAKSGNLQAIKLLFSYTLGKPSETVNPDRVDMEEWDLFKELAQIPKEAEEVALVPDQSLALCMARVMRPELSQVMGKNFLQDIARDQEEVRRKDECKQQQKIKREQHKAEQKKKEEQAGSTNGKAVPSPANGSAAPSPNGKTPPNGDHAPNGQPSPNGKIDAEVVNSPSPNGLEEHLVTGRDPNVFENGKEGLRNRFGSLLHLLNGRKTPPGSKGADEDA